MKKLFVFCAFCLTLGWLYGAEKTDSTAVRNLNGYRFESSSGEKVSFEALNGNYVYLELWSMSCGPCLQEMKFFKELPANYKDKPIRFVAICLENNVALWKKFLAKRSIGGTQWITPILGAFQKENRFFAVPRFVLLDRKGNIIQDNAKRPSDPALKADLDRLFSD